MTFYVSFHDKILIYFLIPIFSYFIMETPDQDLTIQSITAVPRSKNFYNFYINGTNEKRSMKLEGLADFITKLCPAVGGRARTMIYEFRPFYMEIETETLLELQEIPEPSESHRSMLFSGVKAASRMVKKEKERQGSFVSRQKQTLFGNILSLGRKSSQ